MVIYREIAVVRTFLLVTALAAATAPAHAAGLDVGAGSHVDFGNAVVDLACGDLVVAGSANTNGANLTALADLAVAAGGALSGASSSIALGGDFANAGAFAPGSGRVVIGDACGTGVSRIAGANAFHDFTVTSSIGKQVAFPAGLAQTVVHTFALQGAPGHLLQVQSSTPGTKARLNVPAATAQTIAYVHALDNDASGGAAIAQGAASNYHSVDGGNLLNWFSNAAGTNGAVPTPTLDRWAVLLLGALLTAFAWKRRRA